MIVTQETNTSFLPQFIHNSHTALTVSVTQRPVPEHLQVCTHTLHKAKEGFPSENDCLDNGSHTQDWVVVSSSVQRLNMASAFHVSHMCIWQHIQTRHNSIWGFSDPLSGK